MASTAAALGSVSLTIFGSSGPLSHSSSASLTVQPAAPYHLSTSLTALSLTPGSQLLVHVTLVPDAGASPNLIVDIPNAPTNSGLDFLELGGLLTPANPVDVRVDASLAAQPLQNFEFLIVGRDTTTNQTTAVLLPLNVTVPFPNITTKTRSTFVRTDENLTDAVYDPTRRLLFATVETLNEVLVFSTVDGSLKATIPAERPHTVDETVDLTRVYVGGWSPTIAVVDPDLLQIVQLLPGPRPSASPGFNGFLPAFNLRTLSNGKVLILSATGAGPIFLWDPPTGTFTQKNILLTSPADLRRSADHSKVLVSTVFTSGAMLSIYDVATDTFSGPVNVGDTGGIAFAINHDGSQIAALSNDSLGLMFFDSQLNQLGSTRVFDNFPSSRLIYSRDGRLVYAPANFGALLNLIGAFDTQTFAPVGLAPDFSFDLPFPTLPLGIDETGMIFGATESGLALLDVSAPGVLSLPGFRLRNANVMDPQLASTVARTSTTINGAGFDTAASYQVFIGSSPASPATQPATDLAVQNANVINATVPPAKTPGAANVTVTRGDGWYSLAPDGLAFGPQTLFISPSAGPPSGGTPVTVFGYGFTSQSQVTVGGSAATQIQAFGPSGSGSLPLNRLTFTSPPGTPGPADIVISSPEGSTTVPGGFQYLVNAQVFPKVGALDQIIYDQPRQRLYVSNEDHGQVEVFSLSSMTFVNPIPVGNGPAGLALTPDGTRLAVVNTIDGTVSVVDPDTGGMLSTLPALTTADRDRYSCGGVAFSVTGMRGHRVMLDVNCTSLLANGNIHVLDLDTGALSCAGIAGCDSSGADILFGTGLVAIASTQDGSKVVLGDASGSDGPIGLLDVDANQLITSSGGRSDVAVSADANVFASEFGIHDPQLLEISVPQDVDYLRTAANSFNNVPGEQLSPSGSLLFVPQQNATVDVFDVHRERLALRIGLPDTIPSTLSALALDETGSKMFLISDSGIMIAEIAQSPLSIASTTPSSAAPGTQVTIRGSGFLSGASVTFGTSAAVSTFVDTNTLQAIVPAVPAGPVRVTVTNPDGHQYSFDAAFLVN